MGRGAVADLHVNKQRRQPDTRLPSCTQQTPQTQQQESLGRIGYIPSTRPHHCSKAHMSDTENHAVRKPQRLPHKPQTVTKHMSGLNSDIINQSNSNQPRRWRIAHSHFKSVTVAYLALCAQGRCQNATGNQGEGRNPCRASQLRV